VKVAQTRPNVFTVTATSQEISALMAAARLTHDAMSADPTAPTEARELLGRVLADFDAAVARTQDGRSSRPPRDPPASDEAR
jgi:hypothetical protein